MNNNNHVIEIKPTNENTILQTHSRTHLIMFFKKYFFLALYFQIYKSYYIKFSYTDCWILVFNIKFQLYLTLKCEHIISCFTKLFSIKNL